MASDSWDNSLCPPCSSDEAAFIESQIPQEQEKGHFSLKFGPNLLPGMYSMPVHAVSKPGTDKLQLVMDHSTGEFALNNMISKDDIAGVTLDNVQDLDAALYSYHDQFGDVDLLLWKSDDSEAYCQMPMHPLWQIKQVISVGSCRFVDRWNIFGGCASQWIFHVFMSLITWIVVTKLLILLLMIYVDDSFSAQCSRQMAFYYKYNKLLPSDLVKLLNLVALPSMNWMLMQVVDAILPISLDLRVFHILGLSNVVADHLSRLANAKTLSLVLADLTIHTFSPPCPSLGAASQLVF